MAMLKKGSLAEILSGIAMHVWWQWQQLLQICMHQYKQYE